MVRAQNNLDCLLTGISETTSPSIGHPHNNSESESYVFMDLSRIDVELA